MAKISKAIFQNGELISIQPKRKGKIIDNREVAMDNTAPIISDGVEIDTQNSDSIQSLKIPEFKETGFKTVLDLSYNMKIRCGDTEDVSLIPAFVSKTLSLMIASPIAWRRGDYLQVIRNYYRLGLYDAGSKFEADFRIKRPDIFSNRMDYTDEGEHLVTKYHFEDQNHKKQEYDELKLLLPALVPDTFKGYLQIRSKKTKRFLTIQEEAEKTGFTFDFHTPFHYCLLQNMVVDIESEYMKANPNDKYVILNRCCCKLASEGKCEGKDSYHLNCNYQR